VKSWETDRLTLGALVRYVTAIDAWTTADPDTEEM